MKRLVTVVAASVGFASALWAQSTNAPQTAAGASGVTATNANIGVYTLGTVTVTAPKESGFPGLGTTVTPTQLQDNNAKTLAEALSLVPGVNFQHIGPRNETASLVRGFDLRQVPVFIDGMPVYVPYDGYVDIGRFYMFNTSQVTVEKGAASVLYGPNTLGGAINVVTRAPTRALEGDVGFGVEMDRRGETPENFGYFDVGSREGRFYVQSSGSYDNSRFFTLPDSFKAIPTQPDGERINSGNKDWQIQERLGFIPYPDKDDEYSITYSDSQAQKGIPTYAGSDTHIAKRYWYCPEWDKQSVMLATRTELSESVDLKTRAFWDQYKNIFDSYDDATYSTQHRPYAFHSIYDDFTLGGSADLGVRADEDTTFDTIVMFKNDEHNEHNGAVSATGAHASPLEQIVDQTWSFGIEGVRRLTDALEMTAGVRYDYRQTPTAQNAAVQVHGHDSDFETSDVGAPNGQVGLIYHLDKTNEVYATYAHTTRLPTMKDRFSYKLGTAIPNPDLQPEDSDNFEVGYRGAINDRIHVSTAFFCDHTHNTIQSVPITPPHTTVTNQTQNVGVSRIVGWEVGSDILLCKTLTLGGSFTLMDRQDVSNPDIKLTDTPKDDLDIYLSWKPFERLELRPDIEYQSGRFTSADGVQTTHAFALVNLMARYEIYANTTLQFGVENICDRLYEYQEGYPEAGRTFYARANYKF